MTTTIDGDHILSGPLCPLLSIRQLVFIHTYQECVQSCLNVAHILLKYHPKRHKMFDGVGKRGGMLLATH